MSDDTGGDIGHDIHQQKLLLAKSVLGQEFDEYGVDGDQKEQVTDGCPEYGRSGCASPVEYDLQLGNEI